MQSQFMLLRHESVGPTQGTARQPQDWLTIRSVQDLNVMPANSFGNARSERFRARLFGREAPGKIGGGLGAFRPCSSLGIRKQSSQKAVAAPVDSARDPLHLATVRSNANDHRAIARG